MQILKKRRNPPLFKTQKCRIQTTVWIRHFIGLILPRFLGLSQFKNRPKIIGRLDWRDVCNQRQGKDSTEGKTATWQE